MMRLTAFVTFALVVSSSAQAVYDGDLVLHTIDDVAAALLKVGSASTFTVAGNVKINGPALGDVELMPVVGKISAVRGSVMISNTKSFTSFASVFTSLKEVQYSLTLRWNEGLVNMCTTGLTIGGSVAILSDSAPMRIPTAFATAQGKKYGDFIGCEHIITAPKIQGVAELESVAARVQRRGDAASSTWAEAVDGDWVDSIKWSSGVPCGGAAAVLPQFPGKAVYTLSLGASTHPLGSLSMAPGARIELVPSTVLDFGAGADAACPEVTPAPVVLPGGSTLPPDAVTTGGNATSGPDETTEPSSPKVPVKINTAVDLLNNAIDTASDFAEVDLDGLKYRITYVTSNLNGIDIGFGSLVFDDLAATDKLAVTAQVLDIASTLFHFDPDEPGSSAKILEATVPQAGTIVQLTFDETFDKTLESGEEDSDGSTGPIIGGVVGGLLVIGLVVFFVKRKNAPNSGLPTTHSTIQTTNDARAVNNPLYEEAPNVDDGNNDDAYMEVFAATDSAEPKKEQKANTPKANPAAAEEEITGFD